MSPTPTQEETDVLFLLYVTLTLFSTDKTNKDFHVEKLITAK